MSFIDKYIEKDIKNDPQADKEYEQLDLNMEAAVMIRDLRDNLGM
jgi:hypothetical protein